MTATIDGFAGQPPESATPPATETVLLPTVFADTRARPKQKAWYSRLKLLRNFFLRLQAYVVTFFIAVSVNFILPRLMPGSPAERVIKDIEARTGQRITPGQRQAVVALLGDANANIVTQYLRYWANVVRGDLGISISKYPTPVTSLILRALPWTAGLVIISMMISWFIGTGIGALAGWYRSRRIDTSLTLACAFLISVPGFWLGMLIMYVFGFNLHWFPTAGAYDPDLDPELSFRFIGSVLRYGTLPSMTLIFLSFAGNALGMRNMMSQTVSDDFVLLGKAKGLKSRAVGGYAVRNAILPSVAGLAASIGAAFGGAMLIEMVFTYPGIGSLAGAGIGGDFPLVSGVLLMTTIAVLFFNFIADSLYVLIDPRTRAVSES